MTFGAAGAADQPVPADYDGDGRADIAAFRSYSDLPDAQGQADWFILRSSDGACAHHLRRRRLHRGTGRLDGDGTPELAIFDPDLGRWTVRALTSDDEQTIDFGPVGGVPVLAPLAFRLIATGNNPGAGPTPLSQDPDTSLLLPFDGTLRGVGGAVPLSSTGVEFVPGLIGQAAHIGQDGAIRYEAAGNINPGEGTIEFWIRPDWNGDERTDHSFFQVGDPFNDGLILSIDAANNLRFLTWGDDPTTPDVETDVEQGIASGAASWRAGHWHHLAATWSHSSGEMVFYVDGRAVGRRSDVVQIPDFASTSFVIGQRSRGDQPALAAFEEFRISRRARTAAEIAADYRVAISP